MLFVALDPFCFVLASPNQTYLLCLWHDWDRFSIVWELVSFRDYRKVLKLGSLYLLRMPVRKFRLRSLSSLLDGFLDIVSSCDLQVITYHFLCFL